MIRYSTTGNYRQIITDLTEMKNMDVVSLLDRYGRIGVRRLSRATPTNTGELADSWGYYIEPTQRGQKLVFYNTKENDGYKIAILVINGHVTKDGTWVEGNDFVSPIIDDICVEINSEI